MKNIEKKNSFDGSLKWGVKKFYEITERTAKIIDTSEGETIFKQFGDIQTGLMKAEYVTSRPCICGSENNRLLFLKDGFQFFACNECDFLYVNPVFKDDVLNKYYENEDNWFHVLQNKVQIEMDNLKFSYGMDTIEKYTQKGRILDVGCGAGIFLDIARSRKWNCSGIEFNLKAYELLKAKNITAYNVGIENTCFDTVKYDAITFWEVLEHVTNPRMMIKRANNLLNNNGYIFIVVPNKDSLINRMLREKSNSMTGYCHINFFNAKRLQTILEEEGFEVLETETIISELSNIKNHLSYSDAYHGNSVESFKFLTPELIHDNLLGCKLLMLAKKV